MWANSVIYYTLLVFFSLLNRMCSSTGRLQVPDSPSPFSCSGKENSKEGVGGNLPVVRHPKPLRSGHLISHQRNGSLWSCRGKNEVPGEISRMSTSKSSCRITRRMRLWSSFCTARVFCFEIPSFLLLKILRSTFKTRLRNINGALPRLLIAGIKKKTLLFSWLS